jgi:hypothetical protein
MPRNRHRESVIVDKVVYQTRATQHLPERSFGRLLADHRASLYAVHNVVVVQHLNGRLSAELGQRAGCIAGIDVELIRQRLWSAYDNGSRE